MNLELVFVNCLIDFIHVWFLNVLKEVIHSKYEGYIFLNGLLHWFGVLYQELVSVGIWARIGSCVYEPLTKNE